MIRDTDNKVDYNHEKNKGIVVKPNRSKGIAEKQREIENGNASFL